QNIGWQNFVTNGLPSGTEGRSLRLEAIEVELTGTDANLFDVYYQVHAQNVGWMGWARNGGQAGTAGFGYRLEGIRIEIVPKGSVAPGTTEDPFIKK
ncbi:MAG: serine protease, partial [Acetobacterium sp.]|nr:serine protease [Acetobacterium sp.]